METISYQKEVKAIKEHRCNFCSDKIKVGETYVTSTHKQDGDIYSWKTHIKCSQIADRLDMYRDADEGVSDDSFQESISQQYFDLILDQFEKDDLTKYSNVIEQFRCVIFRNKLNYVIRHYAKIDRQKAELLNKTK